MKSATEKLPVIMVSYFDTSVLMAAILQDHELYVLANTTLNRALRSGTAVSTTLHTYAELYNNLTKPKKRANLLSPEQAANLLINNVGKAVQLIELSKADYEAAIERCRRLNLVSAIIYDALHYQAALKAGAEVLYTDNTKDFTRLQLPDETLRIEGIR
ncbi:MAG: type II toxin-antitoxin system VapC family toxin [Bacteroidota bacterium]